MGFTSIWHWIVVLAVVLILFARPGKISGNNVSIFPTILGLSPATQDLVMDIYTPEGDDATNRPAVILLHISFGKPLYFNVLSSMALKKL